MDILTVENLVIIAAVASAGCSIIDAVFPQPEQGSVWYWVRKVLSAIAVNVGNAKNQKKR